MKAPFKEHKQISYPELETEILAWWKKNAIFEKSLVTRKDGIPFTFFEGPPTANGKPGIHHVMARTVKDLFCRYKTLKGYRVERKAGWDTHGLPVEIEVEKALGLEGRHQVEEYGIAEYNKKCRESVLQYKDLWDTLTDRMGYWVDLKNPYVTFENYYIESVWWAIKRLYEKGFLYQGYKIQWYSPGNTTVLSSHEVSLGYKEVQDPSVYIKFPLDEAPDTSFLAWTTTPWTLVSNMALAVNPKITYALIKLKESGECLILAEARIGAVIQEEFELVKTFSGQELVGKTYQPMFEYAGREHDKNTAWKVLSADFVTIDDGTGVVHMAPAFGADDFDTCAKNDIPMFNPIDKDGKFDERIDEFKGQWFKDADKNIVRNLKERSILYRQETYLHNYPHDWRKGTPLMSYPVESWFIRTTAVRDRMVELNNTINWKPESTGTGRFGTWLENNVDWAISRQRYWGTPLPIWVSDKNPEYVEVIGSEEELRAKAGIDTKTKLDFHRPSIDDITWPAPDGGTMRRVPDLLDVWFDSGAMPFAQWHFPFQNEENFEEGFPADFIAEGVDQTRGWFYTLHAIATMLFDKVAYKNVVSNGLVLDANGEKMSKSKGNTVDPFSVINNVGADTTRWYMMSNSAPWENLKFNPKGLEETQRKFFATILNTYSFFALYANIDKFDNSEKRVPVEDRPEMDRWIISRLASTVKEVDLQFEAYEPTKACRAMETLVEEISNWYVRRSRRRFWKSGSSADKLSAYQTLFECLLSLSKMMSPVAPFFAEWLYQQLHAVCKQKEDSVHISFYPTVEETAIDLALERKMAAARQISSMVLRIRNKININVRQPLSRIILPMSSDEEKEIVESVADIILDEINVKGIEYVHDDSGIVEKSAKANFPLLGKKLGKRMKAVAAHIQTMSSEDISAHEKAGSTVIEIDGETVHLVGPEIEIIRHGLQGWSVESEDGLTLALDTTISEELLAEGLSREFVNRVQNMRKDAGFEVTDRIKIQYSAHEELAKALESRAEYIKKETLAKEFGVNPLSLVDIEKQWEIEGFACSISLSRIKSKTS